MRQVQIYVDNEKLDTFNDENIIVNISTQNISDISKVYTDYSQTFTVPASETNNRIFEWYFDNDHNNSVNHSRRRDAFIEVDTVFFKSGKIQLESVELKDSRPHYYKLTFYGDMVKLKDLFQDFTLRDLDHSTLAYAGTGAEIKTRITTNPSTTDYDVKYPLISSSKAWQYGGGGASDITIDAGAINYTNLFPAVRVDNILTLIESQYGVTFNSSFRATDQFQKLFLWYKGTDNPLFVYEPSQVPFPDGTGTPPSAVTFTDDVVYLDGTALDTDTESFTSEELILVINTAATLDYYIDTYINGQFYNSLLVANGGNKTTTIFKNATNPNGTFADYRFFIRPKGTMTYSGSVTYTLRYNSSVLGSQISTVTKTVPSTVATATNLDLSTYAPNYKIVDLIGDVFKMFNLTIVGEGGNEFMIEPLEDFYALGEEHDITEYTLLDTITVARPELYETIDFAYNKSESFMNQQFLNNNAREYSRLRATFDYDGGGLEIKPNAEAMLMQKFTGTNLAVGYALGTAPEYKPYIPNALYLYEYTYQNSGFSFRFNIDGVYSSVTTYVPFGQTMVDGEEYSLNFQTEVSPYTNTAVFNTLYTQYYKTYLENLYNAKARFVTVKCYFPPNWTRRININDTLIIRDKKYIINNMSVNLTTGETQLQLITNFRAALGYEGFPDVPEG